MTNDITGSGTFRDAMADAAKAKGSKAIRERFIVGCQNNILNSNFYKRQIAVATQWNRDAWEISDKYGKIMISKRERHSALVLAGFDKYVFYITAWFHVLGPMGETLTEAEYNEMKKMYMSDFAFNQDYLNSLGPPNKELS